MRAYKNIFILIVLVVLAFFAKIYELPFLYGVSFSFASLFLFVILKYYGLLTATIIAISINVCEFCFFESNTYSLFFVVEILIVGFFWKKSKRDLFVLDTLYWVIIGGPASIIVFYLEMNFIGLESYLFASNNIINGILNVLIADIIICYNPIRVFFSKKEKWLVDLNKMMFHLAIGAVLGPFLIHVFVDGMLSRDKINSQIFQTLTTSGTNIMEQVKHWDINDIRKLRLRYPLQLNKFMASIKDNPINEEVEVLLVDKSCNLYLASNDAMSYKQYYNWRDGGSYKIVDDNIYEWLPLYKGLTFDTSKWNKAFYIMIFPFENVDLQLQVKVNLSNYTRDIWVSYLDKFLILMFFCFIASVNSIMMSRFLSKDLLKLTKSTTGLPDKLEREELIELPEMSIVQVNSLASNFQVMSDNLVKLFSEAKIMNNQLLSQTIELKNSREQMKHLAYYDTLTELPNRLYFTTYLEELIDSIGEQTVAVMFIDLNRFKQINDTLGHEIGDMLIKEVANRLKHFLKDDSFVARLGGDEFVVVLYDTDKKRAAEVARYINKAFGETVKLPHEDQVFELYVSASIGISLYPTDANEKSTLLKKADIAMYAAKEVGENTFKFFDEVDESNISEQLFLEQSLCRALDRNEIEIYYQPKISVETEKIVGMEALIRWNHPQLGMIEPSQFIALAEETGLITKIGEWVLIESCKQNKEWQDKGLPKMRIAVNLSLRQFQGNNFVKTVSNALKISGLEPQYLELEITEGFLIKNTEHSISLLREISNMGIYISIDDFGTGYSSLERLKDLSINFLKVDKSFIRNISCDKNNSAIVAAIIQLAHSMGLEVVAEGVETMEDWYILKTMNCNVVQGYLVSKPVSKVEFEDLVRNFSFSSLHKNK